MEVRHVLWCCGPSFETVVDAAAAPFAVRNGVLPLVRGWLIALARAHERSRQRQTLRDLDDHLLRDIGVTREQAEREAHKPFWR